MSKEKKSLKLEIEFRLSNKDNDEYDDFEDDTLGIDEDFEENSSTGEDVTEKGEIEDVTGFLKSNVNIFEIDVEQRKVNNENLFPVVQKKKEVVITKFEKKFSTELPLPKFENPGPDQKEEIKLTQLAETEEIPKVNPIENEEDIDTRLSCDNCGKVFQCKARLGIHYNQCVSRDLQCSVCLKTFANRRNLREHMKSFHDSISDKSTSNPKFNCQHCGKVFSKKFNYTSHLLKHSNEAAFRCDIQACGKSFKRERTLNKHKQVFHEGRRERYLCGQCGQVFSSQSGFRSHVANHLGKDYIKRNVKCNICDKLFRCLSDMKTHMVVHSKERPFICSWPNCDQAFSQKASLKDHINVHEKRYQCQLCEKAFGRERYLSMHNKTCFRAVGSEKSDERSVPHIIMAMEGVQVLDDTDEVAVMLVHSQEVEADNANVIQVVSQK